MQQEKEPVWVRFLSLNILINVLRWIFLLIGFFSFAGRAFLNYPEDILGDLDFLIPAVVILYTILATFLSLAYVKGVTSAKIFIVFELLHSLFLIYFYGSAFFLLIVVIPLLEAALFLGNVMVTALFLFVIGITLFPLELLRLKESYPVELYQKQQYLNFVRGWIAYLSVGGVLVWCFGKLIELQQSGEQAKKRLLDEKNILIETIEERDKTVARLTEEAEALTSRLLKLEQVSEEVERILVKKTELLQFLSGLLDNKDWERANNYLAKNLEQILQYQSLCIFIANEAGGELYCSMVSSPFSSSLKNLVFQHGEGVVGWVAKQKIPLLIEKGVLEVGDTKDKFRVIIEYEPSALVVPIEIAQEVAGVLYISHPAKEAYKKDDLEMLLVIARCLGTFLGYKKYGAPLKVVLESKEKEFKEKEERFIVEINRLQRILNTSKVLFSNLKLERLLENISDIILNAINLQNLLIFLKEEKEGVPIMKVKLALGPHTEQFEDYYTSTKSGIIGYIFASRRGLLISSGLFTPPDEEGVTYKTLLKTDRSTMIVPLIFKKEILGLIYVSSNEENVYSLDDLKLLVDLSEFISIALSSALELENTLLNAFTDEETGLSSELYFLSRLEEEIIRAKRYKLNFALIMLGIDQEGKFLRRYGQEVYWKLWKEIAFMIKSNVREADLVARVEEKLIGILLLHIKKKEAVAVCERLRNVIAETPYKLPDGNILYFTASLGVANFPYDGEDVATLIDSARLSFDEAQSLGGNRTLFVSD